MLNSLYLPYVVFDMDLVGFKCITKYRWVYLERVKSDWMNVFVFPTNRNLSGNIFSTLTVGIFAHLVALKVL